MKTMELSALIDIVSELSGVPTAEIKEDTALVEDLALNSLKFVELMAIIGEEYDVVIQEEDSVELQTVGQLCEYVKTNQ